MKKHFEVTIAFKASPTIKVTAKNKREAKAKAIKKFAMTARIESWIDRSQTDVADRL